MKKYRSRSSR